jgi:hypothetical protein
MIFALMQAYFAMVPRFEEDLDAERYVALAKSAALMPIQEICHDRLPSESAIIADPETGPSS